MILFLTIISRHELKDEFLISFRVNQNHSTDKIKILACQNVADNVGFIVLIGNHTPKLAIVVICQGGDSYRIWNTASELRGSDTFWGQNTFLFATYNRSDLISIVLDMLYIENTLLESLEELLPVAQLALARAAIRFLF